MVPVLTGWSRRAHSVMGKNSLAAWQRSMFCLLVSPVVVGFSAGTRTVDGGRLRLCWRRGSPGHRGALVFSTRDHVGRGAHFVREATAVSEKFLSGTKSESSRNVMIDEGIIRRKCDEEDVERKKFKRREL